MRQKQGGPEHEYRKRGDDRADPRRFDAPEPVDVVPRLTDQDDERPRSVAPDVETRRVGCRCNARIGAARFGKDALDTWMVAEVHAVDFEIARPSHDVGAV